MTGLVVSSVYIFLILQVLSAQGAREKENGNQKAVGDDLAVNEETIIWNKRDETKPDEIGGSWSSIEDVLTKDLGQSKEEKSISTQERKIGPLSLPQETEDHDPRSVLGKSDHEAVIRWKREIETPTNDSSHHLDASAKPKRKSAKLKLAAVCKSGKASRKFLKAIEQNSNEDSSGEKISFMDDYASPPLTTNTTPLQVHLNAIESVNPNHYNETTPNIDKPQTDIGQQNHGGTNLEISDTREQPSTGIGSRDQVAQNFINNLPSMGTNFGIGETGNSDKEATPSAGTLEEPTGESGRGRQLLDWLSGLLKPTADSQTGNNLSNDGPNNINGSKGFTQVTMTPENKEFVLVPFQHSEKIEKQTNPLNKNEDKINPVDSSTGIPYDQHASSSIQYRVPSARETINENSGSIGTPTSQFPAAAAASNERSGPLGSQLDASLSLAIDQNGDMYPFDKNNPLSTNSQTSYVPSETTNHQMLSITPPLESQSLVDNSNQTPLETTATYGHGVPAAEGGSNGRSGSVGTPASLLSASHNLPTVQNGETYQYDESNPLSTNSQTSYVPSETTNHQMLSITPPLESQSLVDNSNQTLLETTATYGHGVPAAEGGSNGRSGSVGTPASQLGTSLNLPITQYGETYQYDESNPLSTNSQTSYEPLETTNHQMLSIKPPIDNSNGTPLERSASYDHGVPVTAETSNERSGSLGTPASLLSASLNLPTVQNGETYQYDDSNPLSTNLQTSYVPSETTNHQMLSIRPPLESQSLDENSNGTPLEMTAAYGHGVPAAAGTRNERSGSVGIPASLSSASLNLPTVQNGEMHQYGESSIPLPTNLDTSSSTFPTTNQKNQESIITLPLQSQSPVDNSKDSALSLSSTFDKGALPTTPASRETRDPQGASQSNGTATQMLETPIISETGATILANTTAKKNSTNIAKKKVSETTTTKASTKKSSKKKQSTSKNKTLLTSPSISLPMDDEVKNEISLPTITTKTSHTPATATGQQTINGIRPAENKPAALGRTPSSVSADATYARKSPLSFNNSEKSVENPAVSLNAGIENQIVSMPETSYIPLTFSDQDQHKFDQNLLLQGQSDVNDNNKPSALTTNESDGPTGNQQTLLNIETVKQRNPIIENRINYNGENNPLLTNPDISTPPSVANQQIINLRVPPEDQPIIEKSNGTPLERSASYEHEVPVKAETSNDRNGSVGTPALQSGTSLNLPITQNGETYQHDESNPLSSNSQTSYEPLETTNHQMLSIRPPLESQSLVDNSNGTPSETTATYHDEVPVKAETRNERSGSVGTPALQSGTSLNLPINQNGETYQYDDSNPLVTNSDASSLPSATTSQQMLSIRPPLQSQSLVDNSNGTPLETSATYVHGVSEAEGGSNERSGLVGTPASLLSANLNFPTVQNEEAYQYDNSNPLDTISDASSLPSATTSQQMLSIRPPLQSQSLVDNSNGTPLETSATYVHGVSAAEGGSNERSGLVGTPASLLSANLNFPTVQNGEAYQYDDSNPLDTISDASSLPSATTSQQMLSIRPPLQSQSLVDNSNGTLLETSATYVHGVPAAEGGSNERSGLVGTPASLLSANLNFPTVQNGEAYQYDDSNPLDTISDASSLPSATTSQQMLSIRPPLQSQSLVDNSNGTPLETSATYVHGVPAAEGGSNERSGLVGTPASLLSANLNFPTVQNGEAYQYDDSNPLDTISDASSLPSATTSQQMLSIRPPLQSQSLVDNSNGTPLETSATYVHGVPAAEGGSNERSGLVGTPASLLSANLNFPTVQNGEAYQYDDSNPLDTISDASSLSSATTSQQMLSIRPPLQSQSLVDNSNGTPLETSATYVHGVPAAEGGSNERSGLVGTPASLLSANLNFPTVQNGEAYQYDDSNPLDTISDASSLPSATTSQQMLSIRPPLQSQSLVDNSNGTLLETSATYVHGVPAAEGGSNERSGLVGTPASLLSANLNFPTVQNGEAYQYDDSNPLDTISDASSLPSATTSQQMLSIRPPLQSQSLVDNSNGTPLETSATYVHGVPAAEGGSNERSGLVGTPASLLSANLNFPTVQNGEAYQYDDSNPLDTISDASSLPSATTSQQMLSIRPPLQSQSLVDNSNGTPLETSATYVHGVPAAEGGSNERSGLVGTPASLLSANLNFPTVQNGEAYQYDDSNPLDTISDASSLPSATTSQQMLSIRPPLQSQSLVDNSNGTPLDTSTINETPGSAVITSENRESIGNLDANSGSSFIGEIKKMFSWPFSTNASSSLTANASVTYNPHEIDPGQSFTSNETDPFLVNQLLSSSGFNKEQVPSSSDLGILDEPGTLNRNSTTLVGYSPDGHHRDAMLEGNQKLTPLFVTSQLENNPNYTAWRKSIPDSDGLTRPRCVCTCDSNQHFFI